MFKTAKGPQSAASKPDIWAEGAQFAPAEMRHLARVSVILARRKAAGVLQGASALAGRASTAVEGGFGAQAIGRLGRLARALPPRQAAAAALSGISRIGAAASGLIEKPTEDIAPLDFVDLRGYVDQRRSDAAVKSAQTARKADITQAAKRRAAAAAARRGLDAGVPQDQMAGPTVPLRASPPPLVDAGELLAIRAALAAAPEPAPHLPAPPLPVPQIAQGRVFSHLPVDGVAQALVIPAPDPVSNEDKPKRARNIGLRRRIAGAMAAGLGWMVRQTWRLIGPGLSAACAFGLGWATVGAMMPFGLYRAVRLHLDGEDLRYVD